MSAQESDVRILTLEVKHQMQATNKLAQSVESMVKEVHNLVNETTKSNSRLSHVEKIMEDHEKRIRANESVNKANAPVISFIVNTANKAVPTLIVAAIVAIAGVFYVNPFK